MPLVKRESSIRSSVLTYQALCNFLQRIFSIISIVKHGRAQEEVLHMKGYLVGSGYMGLVGDIYMLFTSEEEYEEYLLDD